MRAVDEVGNPTILATLTVIAAILPMAFVGGLMGPYMRPIPVGASAAMVFSLVVAFVVTPWAAVRLLRRPHGHGDDPEDRLDRALPAGDAAAHRRRARRVSRSWVRSRCCWSPRWRWCRSGWSRSRCCRSTTRASCRSSSTCPRTRRSRQRPASPPRSPTRRCATQAVTSVQSYTGTSSPYTFNGLVRHYFLRREPNLADLQVMLVHKDDRREQSHAIAKRLRTRLDPMATRLGARVQVVEVPPGPPVLQTLVAEVYGPDAQRRLELARTVRSTFEHTPGVVDVDWYVESPQPTMAARRRRRQSRGRGPVQRGRGSRRADGRSRRAGGPASRSAGPRRRADRPAPSASAPRIAR